MISGVLYLPDLDSFDGDGIKYIFKEIRYSEFIGKPILYSFFDTEKTNDLIFTGKTNNRNTVTAFRRKELIWTPASKRESLKGNLGKYPNTSIAVYNASQLEEAGQYKYKFKYPEIKEKSVAGIVQVVF